jgi:hypothetical protein
MESSAFHKLPMNRSTGGKYVVQLVQLVKPCESAHRPGHAREACTVGWQPYGRDDESACERVGRGMASITAHLPGELSSVRSRRLLRARAGCLNHASIHLSLIRVTDDARWSRMRMFSGKLLSFQCSFRVFGRSGIQDARLVMRLRFAHCSRIPADRR